MRAYPDGWALLVEIMAKYTDIPLDLEEARECPAFHESLSNLRRGKSKKRSTKEADLKWFFRLRTSYRSPSTDRLPWHDRVNRRLTTAVVTLGCRAPGKGQRAYVSSILTYVPPAVRSHIKNEEMHLR